MDYGSSTPDYYSILQVKRDCDERSLEVAFHALAKKYHPDNTRTADPEKFHSIVEAYNVLRDPDERKAYDQFRPAENGKASPFPSDDDLLIEESAALSDAEMHEKILLTLYKRRRNHPTDAGRLGWLLQEQLGCPEENFEFHIWYLKAKNLIEIDEQSRLAITIEGVDHIIKTSRHKAAQKLISDEAPSEEI